MSDLKPVWPSCEGMQYAHNPYGENYLEVHYDENNNVIPSDKPMHENTTPGMGEFAFSEGHYANEHKSYGVEVGSKGASRENVDVQASVPSRGKES